MLKISLISNNKVNVQRNDMPKKHNILHSRWTQYKNGQISQLTYLKIIGQMFQAARIKNFVKKKHFRNSVDYI